MLKNDDEWQKALEKIKETSKVCGFEIYDWQVEAMASSILSAKLVIDEMHLLDNNLNRFEELTKKEKVKGEKRNGTMTRRQAFGNLFEKGGRQ